MKKLIPILIVLLMASFSYGANVDLKIDGTQYTCTPLGTPPVTPPVVPPPIIPPVILPVIPPTGEALIWGQRYQFSVGSTPKIFIATVSPNRAGLLVDILGITNETDATFTWTFPDGRTFPPPGQPWISGAGTSGGKPRIGPININTVPVLSSMTLIGRMTPLWKFPCKT